MVRLNIEIEAASISGSQTKERRVDPRGGDSQKEWFVRVCSSEDDHTLYLLHCELLLHI